MFLSANAGKRSLALSLRDERGADALRRLADGADVFLQSLRPGLAEELGLGPDVLRARNPRLVYCSLGAYGRVGPLAREPGYDALMQAAGGLISITGESGRPGVRVGSSLIDQGTGTWAALGVLAALLERERTGEGALVDVSLYETAVGYIGYHLAGYLADGTVPRGEGTRFPMVAPYEVFPTADGELMIAGGNDRLFRSICEVVGLPELVDDPRFRTNPDRVRNRDALVALLVDRLATDDTADVAPTAHRRRRPGRAGCRRGGRGGRGADAGARHPPARPPSPDPRSDARRSAAVVRRRATAPSVARRPTSGRTPPRSCARHGYADVRDRGALRRGSRARHDGSPLRLLQRHAAGAPAGQPRVVRAARPGDRRRRRPARRDRHRPRRARREGPRRHRARRPTRTTSSGSPTPSARSTASRSSTSPTAPSCSTSEERSRCAPKSPIRTRDDLSMAYTPGVARISAAIAADPGAAWTLTSKQNTVAVVTDGTAVLGLGNIGPEAALPVMEGKAALFKEFAGVDAWPICLATTDPDEIVAAVQGDRAGVRRDQPRGHLLPALLRDRAPPPRGARRSRSSTTTSTGRRSSSSRRS